MPSRRLPNSNSERNNAVKRAYERVNQVPPPAEIPFTPTTLSKLDFGYAEYQTKLNAAAAALGLQTEATASVNETRKMASYFVADMLEAMQRAVRRGTFAPSARAYYQLPVAESQIPPMRTETEVLEWGAKTIAGETNRIAAGGNAITFPDLAEVTTAFDAFKNANLAQAERKTEYDNAQHAVTSLNEDADKLILKLWNETETFFDEGDKPAMRRKAREWGVVYVPSAGETPSPTDFSLMGKATLEDGTAVADVSLSLSNSTAGLQTFTDPGGNYYFGVVAGGTYQLLATKEGFDDVLITGIVITDGQLAELDVLMQPTEPEPPVEP